MKDRNFFLVVMFALLVPCLIGGVYLIEMSHIYGSQETIAKASSNRELLIFGEREIDGIGNLVASDEYRQVGYIEFEVDYASGSEPITSYNLVLDNVVIPRRLKESILHWRLEAKGQEDVDYVPVASGTFKRNNREVYLGNFQIALSDSRKYRLYYYASEEVNNRDVRAYLVVK